MTEEKKYPQQDYNKRWAEKNKAHKNYLSSRSSARSFIRNKATAEDLQELQVMIEERLKELDN
ncbi:hypothetical protein SORDD17_01372 [Streptococcus oralis]|uniref:Uncharacterized protein n=1 Tax=Streptococcus oralis TaxID=1303 RepID=A0A139RII4_STROR|nr:hypothetical protein [Streptococcus oralis]KXU14579.1 hypothetical protein SORDD17_01372 [Streptococcus oralis]